MFRCVWVWERDPSPETAARSCAREWAARLGVPCRVVPIRGTDPGAFGVPEDEPPGPRLGVIGRDLPLAWRESLLRWSLTKRDLATLVPPEEWAPGRRALVLNPTEPAARGFLRNAVGVCRLLRSEPVVLTVAANRREALRRQEAAAAVLDGHGETATLDWVAGCTLPTALTLEAHCRQCSFVFVDGREAVPRRRWLWREPPLQLSELSRWLAFLTLPELEPLVAPAHGPTPSPW